MPCGRSWVQTLVASKKILIIAMNIIQEFGNLSGLKLNKNKTEGIWQGRLKHTKDKYENITWTNEPSDPEPSNHS
jgi:hypothetical protein